LLAADPVLLQQVAPTFFGLTVDGCLELAQMAVARLYDKTRGAVTIRSMLHDAAGQPAACQNATPTEAAHSIFRSVQAVIALQPILDSIRKRRNVWLAHLDPETVANPQALAAEARLTLPDLERAFQQSEKILVELGSLYEGVFGELEFIGQDDYQVALELIRAAKCVFIENYKREFGHPFTGPRPKVGSNHLLIMPC